VTLKKYNSPRITSGYDNVKETVPAEPILPNLKYAVFEPADI
jgi:hypothetical protein